jgi:hypothetical protein
MLLGGVGSIDGLAAPESDNVDCLHIDAGNDAKVAGTALQGLEQVRASVLGDADDGTSGEDDHAF